MFYIGVLIFSIALGSYTHSEAIACMSIGVGFMVGSLVAKLPKLKESSFLNKVCKGGGGD